MRHGQWLRIALLTLVLVGGWHGLARADFQGDLSRPISEPATLFLLSAGAAALGGIDWVRRRRK